jgi:cytochrome c553
MKKLLLALLVIGSSSIVMADGASIFKKCASCHGSKAEKKALRASKIIAGWKEDKIIAALQGFKAGTYGGSMKGIMKGQASSLSDNDMKNVAKYISGLN